MVHQADQRGDSYVDECCGGYQIAISAGVGTATYSGLGLPPEIRPMPGGSGVPALLVQGEHVSQKEESLEDTVGKVAAVVHGEG